MSITEFDYKSGFPAIRLTHPNGSASVEVLLYGGHILSWTVDGHSLLFMSDKAIFEHGKAIRGGVPIVWPQFGPGALAQHGFARVKVWRLGQTKIDDNLSIELHLTDDDETIKIWPNKFQLTLTIRLTGKTLHQSMTVENRDDHSFDFTALFHTYFSVDDIKSTKISGLNKVTYVDKVDGAKTKTEENSKIEFVGETDRVYKNGAADGNPITINDKIQVIGSTTTTDVVVWNPWQNKAKASADIGEENYPKFVCVEIGHVSDPVKLEKGAEWTGYHELALIE